MDNKKNLKQKKLFYESYSSYNLIDSTKPPSIISKKTFNELKNNNVKTVFLITSETVDSESFLSIIKKYKETGIEPVTIYIENISSDHLYTVKNTVNRIFQSFNNGNCLIISYGKSYALTITTCFYIYIGKSVSESISSLIDIRKKYLPKKHDIQFLNTFEKFIYDNNFYPWIEIDTQKKPVDQITKEKTKKIEEKITKDDKIQQSNLKKLPPKDKLKTDQKKPSKKELKKIHDELLKSGTTGHIFRSLKFKLITIISAIIIVSLSGMIFVATFFFKKDNELRAQENNLKISEIIASKVESEFDKSKVIASTMLKESQLLKDQSEAIDYEDSDILFAGLKTKTSKGQVLTNASFNMSILNKYQISKARINDIITSSSSEFSKSFYGETIIQNVSQSLDSPVISLSIPFKRDRNKKVDSILITFIKLDNLLKSFQISGLTKAFMVNEKGDILAHPDVSIVLSGSNFSELPIVDKMIKSKIDNSQTRYKDKDGIYYLGSFKKIKLGGCGIIATINEDKAFQEVYNIQRRNIYLMAIVLSLAILIVFFFGKTITTPIIRLVAATKQIIEGEYQIDIIPTTKDEIGELTYSFIEMGKGLEEREKIKNAFGKFVNKEIADAAMRDELKLGGEKKIVAIFFSDIRSFTAISENLEPEEVVEFLNDYMTRMVKCVENSNGVVDKFIGDAIMAIWGTPISKGNDTEDAVNGALMMRDELIKFNEGRGDTKKPIIKIGCGINTGPALAGQIGSEDRMEYTVIGDAVNLASRIEALNKPFGTDILISQDSFDLVQGIYYTEKMQQIKVKGKEDPQQIYAVLGRKDDPNSIKTIDDLRILLNIDPQQFNRRSDDKEKDLDKGEVKYEIIEG